MARAMDWEKVSRHRKLDRPTRPVSPITTWYMTYASMPNVCAKCEKRIPPGATFGFNTGTKACLCKKCVADGHVSPVASRKLQARRGRGRAHQ